MAATQLHYVYVPLCGWCYAVAPLVKAARELASIELHGGGMMTGARRQQITPAWREYVAPHDRQITQATGQQFGQAYLNGLLTDHAAWLDSEPPTAAVLAAEQVQGAGLDMLARLYEAHYVGGRRIADDDVLSDLAGGNVPIQAYLRMPKGEKPRNGWPILLFICGLDAYKTDHTPRTQVHVDRGFATLSFEIPGTGDCPAAPNDPASPDRLMSSIFDWVVGNSAHYGFDLTKIVARGISTRGYYAMRVAHTHADRLFAVVAQGGACHYLFDAEWIRHQDQMEYPFALAEALAHKFGYRDPDSVSAYAAGAQKFSLLASGVLDNPSCKLFVINGMEDSIFPIEDNFIVGMAGKNKDLLARGNRPHMGNPGAEDILYDWIDDAVAGKP